MISRVASLLRIRVPDKEPGGLLIASGKAVPADGAIGYQPGCLFIQTSGTGATSLYINEGTGVAADFNPVFSLTSAQKSLIDDIAISAAEINAITDPIEIVTVTEATKETAITASARVVKITGGTGFSGLVLPLPTAAEVGMVKQITLDTITSGSVAMTITDVAVGGSQATTATFSTAGQTLYLIGKSYGDTFRWSVLKEDGVVLS